MKNKVLCFVSVIWLLCSGFNFAEEICPPDDIMQYVSEASELYELEESLIYAVIRVESNFDVEAKNSGCYGLMQVSEKWHEERMERLGVTDLYDAEGNIMVGCDYLDELLEDYDLEFALMVYNQGYSSAKRTWKNYGQSNYSKKVIGYSEDYESLLTKQENY